MTNLYAVVGDDKQTRTVTLKSGTPATAVDLTNASAVAFHATGINNAGSISKAGTFVASTAGTASVQLVTADLVTAGVYSVEWQVTFSDGTVATFPDPGTDTLTIRSQLA